MSRKTSIAATLLSIWCLISAVPLLAQNTGVDDLLDPSDPAATLDLVESPLSTNLLQRAALKFRDKALESQFVQQLRDLTSTMKSAVDGKKLGYLPKVEMCSDESGTPVIPGGQLVFPIGAGTEPVDALAEFIRVPRVEAPRPTNLENDSYYL